MIVVFLLLYVAPGDPVQDMVGERADAETIARLRKELHLDEPLPKQFVLYASGVLRGDLGRSYKQSVNVTELLLSRLPATLELMLAGIVFELLLGIPAGILAALRPSSFVDRGLMMLAAAVPSACANTRSKAHRPPVRCWCRSRWSNPWRVWH